MSESTLQKFIEAVLEGESFDPGLEAMTSEQRIALISAGDDIEDVLTKTLDTLAKHSEVQVRGLDTDRIRRDIARLTFWEQKAALFVAVAKLIRDQELVLEDRLQRDLHHISKETKHYTQSDNILAAELDPLIQYTQKAKNSRKRNRAILDRLSETPKP